VAAAFSAPGFHPESFPNARGGAGVYWLFEFAMIRLPRPRHPAALFAACLLSLCSTRVAAAANLEFNRDIRPILSDRCFKCHGPDKAARKSGLRLDLPDEAYAERKKSRKHAIVPGKPEESLLCEKIIATDPDDLMPPPDSHLALSDGQKNTLRRWVAEGAKYQPPWAFIPLPDTLALPAVKNRRWPRNEIDRFILARLEQEGVKPSPEAGKSRWLRRVSYDLTGLPPSPAEVEAFLADKSAAAYEKMADRLLASKRFGERMATPWLDAARYADSYGYQSDQLSPTWPFRDWVVEAFNDNLPYDKFLTDQLAGDLLPNPTRRERLGTAFNRLHRQTNEGGSIEEEWRTEYVSDRVHTFSSAFLALTFQCAHCHDHKFDPITQRDYYSLSAFFNSIDEWGLYNDTPRVPTPSLLLPNPEQEKAMKETARVLREKNERVTLAVAEAGPAFQEWLQAPPSLPEIPGLTASYNFDQLGTNNTFANAANPKKPSGVLRVNTLAPGRSGHAVKFTGDDELAFPGVAGALQPWDQYSIVFWVRLPAGLTNGALLHRLEGTDAGFHGTELSVEDGRLFFVIKRFWPGNALAVRSTETVPQDQWVQIGVSYDGSGRAAGMTLFLNGRKAQTGIVRDHLFKSPQNGGGGFSFGALFRSMGLKDGLLDDLRVYDRPLAPVEVAQLYDRHALRDALAVGEAEPLRDYYLAAFDRPAAQARTERAEALKKYLETCDPVMETSVMEELPLPRPAYALARGRYDAPKTEENRVSRTTPAMLPPFPANAPRNRLGLAEWLTDPRHPLTARVAVNRFWQQLFGRGIVATTDNFGAQGAEPTHPALLDWLARDFINSGWNVKAALKKIVLSATYRQDSRQRQDLREKDPENLLLARGPSHRLPAEMIRDTALAAGGLLDEEMGGPPVSPYMPGDLWRESNSMSPAYHQSVGGSLYRRSLYTVWKRTAPMPDMTAFDAPSREVCEVQRTPTSTPQQSFVLLNDTQFVEAARALAEKSLREGGSTPREWVRYIFRRLTARDPDPREMKLLLDLLQEQAAIFAKEPDRAVKLIAVGARKPDPALNPVQLAAATELAQAVMNLDATIWKR
jgi:hypothetical protein